MIDALDNQQLDQQDNGIISLSCAIDKKECNAYSSPLATGSSETLGIPYEVAFCSGVKSIFITKDGHPFTEEERKRQIDIFQKACCRTAEMVGAICLEMDVNGKKSFWYNDASCHDACELSPEELKGLSFKDMLDSALKKDGTSVDDAKATIDGFLQELNVDIESEEASDEDKAIAQSLIGLLEGGSKLIDKLGEKFDSEIKSDD